MNIILPKGPKFAVLVVLTAVAFTVVVFLEIITYLNSPTGTYAGAEIDISKGATTSEIAHVLRERQIIRSESLFYFVSRFKGYATGFKAGRYHIPPGMRTMEIARFLAETLPTPAGIKVTIPEGLTLWETASILQKKAGVDSSTFVTFAKSPVIAESLGIDNKTLEGYLYPETYFICEQSRVTDIIRQMVAQFRKVFTDSLKMRAEKLDMTINQTVTLASLIETEAVKNEERPIISQVFHLRIKLGYPLQANPTIQYILGEKRRIVDEDLNIDSPYNTYLHTGLPPGPIANPGIESIRAALYPADTKYLYFVSDSDSSHVFSKTLAQHNIVVSRYLKKRNQKAQ